MKQVFIFINFPAKTTKDYLKHSKQFNFAKDVVSLQSIVQGKFKQKKVAIEVI